MKIAPECGPHHNKSDLCPINTITLTEFFYIQKICIVDVVLTDANYYIYFHIDVVNLSPCLARTCVKRNLI